MNLADGEPANSVYVPATRPPRAGVHHLEEVRTMDLINDWGSRPRIAPTNIPKGPKRSAPVSPEAISAGLAALESELLSVHCYEDVGYPWVQIVFRTATTPDLALRVGNALADVAGAENVYFNSLRPEAVYFVLEPAFDPKPELPASRYGAILKDVQAAWFPQESKPKSATPSSRRRTG
jgi:hypothetical protein